MECHAWSVADVPPGPAQPTRDEWQRWQLSSDEHPRTATLVDVLRVWPQFACGANVHLIHRLDRATSGLLLVGRSEVASAELATSLAAGSKVYAALVRGATEEAFTVDRPLRQKSAKMAHGAKAKREAMRDARHTQVARTAFVRLASVCDGQCTLLLALPSTGRFHQIRRHLDGLRHQISGDATYGPPKLNTLLSVQYGLERLFLHLCCVLLPPRRDGAARRFTTGLPHNLCAPLKRMQGGGEALRLLDDTLRGIDEAWAKGVLRSASRVVLTETWRSNPRETAS
jgi:tRNA pseudouridine65 synthase